MLTDDVARVLIDEETLANRVRELGAQVSADYRDRDLLLLCILKGGIVFLADLMRCIDIPHGIEFMAISSYGAATDSSGIVRIVMDLEGSILDRDVLLVEDIVDTGNTLSYVKNILQTRGPRSLKICSLLNKPDIPNEFVVGYGLDFDEKYRNLRYIGVLKPELYLPAD